MRKLIDDFSEKLEIPRILYVVDKDIEIYKNINKEISNISNTIIFRKIVTIVEENIVNNEILFLISFENNILGWISPKKPIIIYNTFPQKVQILDNNTDNAVNRLLSFQRPLELNNYYEKKYFIEHKNQLYFGICEEGEIISFIKPEQFTDGEIKPMNFKFKKDTVNLYHNTEKKLSHSFLNDNNTYVLDYVFINDKESLGSFKFGRNRYWFEICDCDIDLKEINYDNNYSKDYYLLEHLLYTSNQISKMQSNFNEKISLEEEIVYSRINNLLKKINDLENANEKLKN